MDHPKSSGGFARIVQPLLPALLTLALAGGAVAQEVYLALVLDASGSMYARLDDGRYRIDAAKSVLQRLVSGLPDDARLNVGLRVYGARKRYVPGAKFSTWLFTIANNVAASAVRRLSRRREVDVVTTESSALAAHPFEQMVQEASGLMPTRQFDRNEMRQMVQEAIGTLNERQRMAVLLSKFEHMSYAEIGEVMELSPQAIKSLVSRARGKLKEALQPYLASGDASQKA